MISSLQVFRLNLWTHFSSNTCCMPSPSHVSFDDLNNIRREAQNVKFLIAMKTYSKLDYSLMCRHFNCVIRSMFWTVDSVSTTHFDQSGVANRREYCLAFRLLVFSCFFTLHSRNFTEMKHGSVCPTVEVSCRPHVGPQCALQLAALRKHFVTWMKVC